MITPTASVRRLDSSRLEPGLPKPPVFSIDIARFKADPYPVLAQLRQQAPIALVPELGSILFTQRDDIARAEKNIDVFSSHQPEGLMNTLMGHNMMRKDGGEHQSEKKIIFPSVSPATVKNHWLPQFQIFAERAIDRIIARKSADLVSDFAAPFSADCLRSLTGLRNVSAADIDRCSQHMIDGIANYGGDPEVSARCTDATRLLDDAIDNKAAQLNDDSEPSMLAVMLNAGMPMESVQSNIKLAISGGQNEPRDAIAGACWALLNHPDQLKQVKDEQISWLSVFEEYARWISPIGMSPRRVAAAHAFNDIDLEINDKVFFMFSSANRDESVFENADQFDASRDTSKSIAFGAGPHFCAGAWASRAMIADVALPTLFRRLENLRLSHDEPRPEFDGWAFRGLLNLPVRWD